MTREFIRACDLPYGPGNEDYAHDGEVQREVDEEADKRRASGFSPEELSIQDAYMEGQRACSLGTAAGLNPYVEPGSPHYQAWERGRSAAEGYRRNRMAA